MNRFTLLRLIVVSLVLGITSSAFAEQTQSPLANKGQVGLTLGYGIYVGDGGDDFNPYNLALGIHGGYTLDMNLFVGGFFNFFLGESEGDASARFMQIAADVGYDLAVGPVIIRPTLGVGAALFTIDVPETTIGGVTIGGSDSETYLLLAPGAKVIYPLEGFYIGGELRYFWLPSEDGGDGFLIALNGGAAF